MTDSRLERAAGFLKRYRWWLIWAAGLLLSVGWTLRLLLGLPSVVTPSEETTYLTGRTLADGSLDFSAALASHCNIPIDDADNVAMGLRVLPEPHSTLVFLNRYAVEQTTNPEQAFEVFTVLAAEQGIDFGEHVFYSDHQGVLVAWTGEQYPVIAALLQMQTDYIEQWKAAVRRPSIVKPVGTTLDEISRDVHQGAGYTLVRGMMHAGEGQWKRAVDDFSAIDTAIEHLCRLQCGWKLRTGLTLRRDMSLSLVKMMKTLAETRPKQPLDPTFIDYVRNRTQWPMQEVVCEGIDNNVRIKAQTDIREFRDPNKGRLEWILGPGLTKIKEARSVQVTQLRNSIDWQTTAQIQNQAVDDYLESIRDKGLSQLNSQRSHVSKQHATAHDSRELFNSIRELSAEDITVPLAWLLVNRFTAHRMMLTIGRAAAAHRADRKAILLVAMTEFRDRHDRWPTRPEELQYPSEATDPDTGAPFVSPFDLEESSNGPVPHLPRGRPWSRILHLAY